MPVETPTPPAKDNVTKIKDFMTNNMVTIMFVVLGLLGFIAAEMSPFLFLVDMVSRISRNAFLVLSLIIPVMAGMGMNFSIVLGAMAAQGAVIFVTHWGIDGLPGILLVIALATPVAMLLGYLTGQLFNKTKGQEMIAGLILAFFAQGIYELIFLQLIGPVIPMDNARLVLSRGTGIRTTIDLTDGLKYGMDWPGLSFGNPTLLRLTLPIAAIVLIAGILGYFLFRQFMQKRPLPSKLKLGVYGVLLGYVGIWSVLQIVNETNINNIRIPLLTAFVIFLCCMFIVFFSKTKLGQDMRSVGQDRHVAAVAGINVNRVRIIAIMMSMVMAAIGHTIFLQNLGTFSTYGSHEQVGLYSVAALLIGGATVTKATIGQALLGVFLFHTLFIVAPPAGRQLFGDAQVGEYFRVFAAYGVIGVSLAMYAWKKRLQDKSKLGL
ncbi:MAG: ABC transporter permease [Firmicutes bacterium]|nr:ABC transporter permease [Bacillota bacterium]